MDPRPPELPRWLWLHAPFAILAVQVAARLGGDDAYRRWMRGEVSVPELGTVLWLLVAVGAGLAVLRRRELLPQRWLGVWVALFTLGCLFFAGEEASWGQHYFGWRTPEALASANDQRETNVHNLNGIGALFDQFPRMLLTLAAVAALVVAWRRRHRPERFGPSNRWHWIWPTGVVVPSAVLALAIGLPKSLLGDRLPYVLQMQVGEFKEYFLAMFLALYALSLRRRLGVVRTAAAQA
jgi:hypothetical protein